MKTLVMVAAEVVVEEIERKENTITVFVPPAEFFKAKNALHEAFPKLEFEVQEIVFIPQETKTLSAEDQATFEKFLGMVNESDDVQEIYHNVSLPN